MLSVSVITQVTALNLSHNMGSAHPRRSSKLSNSLNSVCPPLTQQVYQFLFILFVLHLLLQLVEHTLLGQEIVPHVFVMQSRVVFCPIICKVELTGALEESKLLRVC